MRSMPFDPGAVRRWLDDSYHHIVLAQKFAGGMNLDALHDDPRTTYAVTSCLEIISEASRRLPDGLKARHPSIQWRPLATSILWIMSGIDNRRDAPIVIATVPGDNDCLERKCNQTEET